MFEQSNSKTATELPPATAEGKGPHAQASTRPAVALHAVEASMLETIRSHKLLPSNGAVLLMVSGGSDSTALAYAAAQLKAAGCLGPVAMLHVNHQLRSEASDDERFVAQLAEALNFPLFACSVDVAGEAQRTGGNVEAVGRKQRYLAANQALESMCEHHGVPLAKGRIFTAHTADDRVENFYMRSIVGTGPGGFRSMLYENGPVVRPLLELSRNQLRSYIQEREASGLPVVCDEQGNLWREDATNAHTDHFRAFVRHTIVPQAKERNPQLTQTLTRTMNLIADEDDLLEHMASDIASEQVQWLHHWDECGEDYGAACVLLPGLGEQPLPLQRRVVVQVLQRMLPAESRIETAAVDAVLAAWEGRGVQKIRSGYVTNIQGNLAVSANKQGVRIEAMEVFRARRKRS